MKIAELFYSIQGEGVLVGVPSVFIRTSGCNLRCVWCDTPYTSWHPEGQELALDEIVSTAVAFGAAHVVVTGGEPMIAPEIVALTQRLRDAGVHITIETAGTIYAAVACDLMSISPKLANSIPLTRDDGRWAGQHNRLLFQPEVLKRLTHEYPFQMKFVVAAPEDLTEIEEIRTVIGIDPSRIVLMPEGTNADVLHSRSIWLAEVCKRTRFRYSPRLHVDLWGDRRGV